MKGECGIALTFFKKYGELSNENEEFKVNKKEIEDLIIEMPSSYNDYFNVLLADDKEPILLTGPSGYKQFLSQQILDQPKVVSLNQESSIDQLLGSSIFLKKKKQKNFT